MKLIAAAMLVALAAAVPAGQCSAPPSGAVLIFGEEAWYLERPEPEQDLQGVLENRPPARGPNDRGGLAFTLVMDRERLPVYAANAEEKLQPYVGRPITVRAKVVDLSSEGFGREVWVGWVVETMKN
jgi:hypothetical protein